MRSFTVYVKFELLKNLCKDLSKKKKNCARRNPIPPLPLQPITIFSNALLELLAEVRKANLRRLARPRMVMCRINIAFPYFYIFTVYTMQDHCLMWHTVYCSSKGDNIVQPS